MTDIEQCRVKTIDDGLRVFVHPDFNSASRVLSIGSELQLGHVSDIDGHEWVEVELSDGEAAFAVGASARSHTNVPVPPRILVSAAASPGPICQPLPRYAWGAFVGALHGLFAIFYIVWAIIGDNDAVRGAYHGVPPPWQAKAVLGALCAATCVGILRYQRFGVVAFAISNVVGLALAVYTSERAGLSFAGSLPSFCITSVLNGVYFAKRWDSMGSGL
jgi:hypothetical protein